MPTESGDQTVGERIAWLKAAITEAEEALLRGVAVGSSHSSGGGSISEENPDEKRKLLAEWRSELEGWLISTGQITAPKSARSVFNIRNRFES